MSDDQPALHVSASIALDSNTEPSDAMARLFAYQAATVDGSAAEVNLRVRAALNAAAHSEEE